MCAATAHVSGIMKAKKTIGMLMAMLAALAAHGAGERVERSDLPLAVQKALKTAEAEGPVKEVTRHTVEGRTVYVAEIDKNNAPNPRLRITEDGEVQRAPALFTDPVHHGALAGFGAYGESSGVLVAPMYPRLSLSDVPEAVQEIARDQAQGRDVVDVDRETWNGKPVYEIEFREKGLNSRIYVDESGSIVRDEQPRRTVRSLFMGMQLEDTPAAVQTTVRAAVGERQISDIDRETSEERVVYRVELRSEEGLDELIVAEDGRVLRDAVDEERRAAE